MSIDNNSTMMTTSLSNCHCYECSIQILLDLLKVFGSIKTNIRSYHGLDVLPIIPSLRLEEHWRMCNSRILLWVPEGQNYCVYAGSNSNNISNIMSKCKNILCTAYNIYDVLNKTGGCFIDFSRMGGGLPDRYVRVQYDEPWDFYEVGEPLPFEYTDCYTLRIKKKRLTDKMVIEYMCKSGYNVLSPSFYHSSECYIIDNVL